MTPPNIVPNAFVSFGSMVTRMAGNLSPISLQKRIVRSLAADCCRCTMPGNDERVVVIGHQFISDGRDDFRIRPAPEIRPADSIQKERITGKQDVSNAGQKKCGAAGSVAG